MSTITSGINFKFSDSIFMLGRGLACLIFAFVSAWKFSIVFLAIAPLIIISMGGMIFMIRKYTIKEFAAYGSAGAIAQEVLSSIRTVFSLRLQNNLLKKYLQSLSIAERMSIKKGAVTSIFTGLAGLSYNITFAIAIYYGVYLTRTDCEHFKPGLIMQAFFSMITAMFAVGQALPFLRDLSEG